MKNIRSLAASLVMAMTASLALADSIPLISQAKTPQTIISKPAAPQHRSDSGFYVGVGVGTFKSANKLKEVNNQEKEINHPGGSLKGKPNIFPNILVGYKFNKYFRTALNAQYRRFHLKNSSQDLESAYPGQNYGTTNFAYDKIKNYSIFLNGYFDIPFNNVLIPYITGGIGYSRIKSGKLTRSNSDWDAHDFVASGTSTNNLAWNMGVGLQTILSKSWSLDLGYRYVDLGKMKLKATHTKGDSIVGLPEEHVPGSSRKIKTHEVTLGVVYNF